MTRPVKVADADMLVPLFAELDHPATASRIAQRLVRLRADDTYQAWVTIASDGDEVCGFAAGHLVHPIEDDNVAAQLIALVTASTSRGIGAGANVVCRVRGLGHRPWCAASGGQFRTAPHLSTCLLRAPRVDPHRLTFGQGPD